MDDSVDLTPRRRKWGVRETPEIRTAKRRARYRLKMISSPEEIRAERRRYAKRPATENEKRRATMRSMLWHVLIGGVKSGYMVDLIGCTVEELRAKLETQFHSGWTWADYGTLFEIDHIKPCRDFDLTDPAQQRACFHFSNIRPLEKAGNRGWRRALLAA